MSCRVSTTAMLASMIFRLLGLESSLLARRTVFGGCVLNRDQPAIVRKPETRMAITKNCAAIVCQFG